MKNINILIFNCGSSSLNYKVFRAISSGNLANVASGKAHRVGVKGNESSFIEHKNGNNQTKQILPIPDHQTAAKLVLDYLREQGIIFHAIGHRFVHGGGYFQKPALLTIHNQPDLEACLELAPIHNPNSMSVIKVCQTRYPEVPEYVSFDTAFHAGMPEWAYTYPLPLHIRNNFGLRKYGFHGLSYKFVSGEIEKYTGISLEKLKIVVCHLGTGGSSVVAIRNGQSIDTSMGFSPLPGLMMSTRTGDLDPTIPLYIEKYIGIDPEKINAIFNKQSGLLGISGFSSDIRDILENKDKNAVLAFEMYTYRLKKYIGAYATMLGGLDILAFTDDIGVQNWQVRDSVCSNLEWIGISLDHQANKQASHDNIAIISLPSSQVKVMSIPTDEEIIIGREGVKIVQEALC